MPPVRMDIRNEHTRLLTGTSAQDIIDTYHHVINTGFKLIASLSNKSYTNIIEHDADLLFQMTMLKCHSVLKLMEGFTYKNPIDGVQFKHTLDPFSIWPIVRSQYEACCALNNIFLNHSGEEQLILYNLWILSGLNYRQLFKDETKDPENLQKIKDEQNEINKLIDEIKNSNLFKMLPPTEQKKILDEIKRRNWQFKLKTQKLEKLSWREMAIQAGIQIKMFGTMYAYLSLNTHPSNVSVFQFKIMYQNNEHYHTSLFAVQMSRILIAFLIRDYCTLFPGAQIIYNALPENSQLLINAYNRMFRSPLYVLNNIEDHV